MRLKNKVAIVTGGALGIGRTTSFLFAREGAKVMVTDIREKDGTETATNVKRDGGEAVFRRMNVTRAEEVMGTVKETIRIYGGIDILFNNAGIMPEASMKGVTDLSEEVWDHVIDVNLKGVFLASKYVIPAMIERGGGSIVNMSSTHGHTGAKNRSVYVASKGGVTLLTKSMALDYAQYKVRVNCISPAAVETGLTGDYLENVRKDEVLWKELMLKVPLGRLGTPQDIAYAALFLASDESSWITGASILVDGGYTAQ